MIKPMIDTSFLAYGVIEQSQKELDHKLDHIPLPNQKTVPIYCFSVPTSWNYVEGMTVLLILDGTEIKQYYLDRAITIRPGVRFGYYAMGDGSTIAGDGTLLSKETCVEVLDISAKALDHHQMQIFTMFWQEGKDGLFFRGEQHRPLELVYVEKGELVNYSGGQKFTLHPNQFFIFDSNQWHMQYADQEVRFLTVSFIWEGHDFSHLFNRIIVAPSEIQRSIQMLHQEYDQGLPQRDEFLRALSEILFLQIHRLAGSEVTVKKPSPASERLHRMLLDKAMQIVSERIYGKLSVSDLAAAVNVSTSQLTVLFRTYLGMSPAKYITHIRLEESKNMLSKDKVCIGEIAELLGYASVQHYSKQFRNWFGITPSSFANSK